MDMSITVYNPSNGPSLTEKKMAKRLQSFEDSIIGLIDNGKKNSDVVVQHVAQKLREKYHIKGIIYHKKSSFSHGLTKDEAKMLAEKYDFIITGVGD